MSRIALLGGTFDPPHCGHLELGRAVAEALGLSCVLLMPDGKPNFKQGQQVTSVEHRVAMTRLLCAEDPRFALSTLEVDRPGITYTADTLEQLAREHPDDELVLIVGGDCAEHIMTWKRADVIARLCTVVTAARPGFDFAQARRAHEGSAVHFNIEYLTAELPDISSTQVRTMAAEGCSLEGLVPQSIESYIIEHKLYTE